MTDIPTPRTDWEADTPESFHMDNLKAMRAHKPCVDVVDADFARQLERELAQSREAAEHMRIEIDASRAQLKGLRLELAEAREQASRLAQERADVWQKLGKAQSELAAHVVSENRDYAQGWEAGQSTIQTELAELRENKDRYYELILAVSRIHEGETRHQTALRYIRERETVHSGPCQSAAADTARKDTP
jgi:chromosome segregation ATPase